MLDIKVIRENEKGVKKNCKNRGYGAGAVDEVLKFDEKWRKLKTQDDKLRCEKNKVSREVNEARKKKDEKKVKELIKKAKQISAKLKDNEGKERKLKEKIGEAIAVIPNIQQDDVPVGGEKDFKVLSIGAILVIIIGGWIFDNFIVRFGY